MMGDFEVFLLSHLCLGAALLKVLFLCHQVDSINLPNGRFTDIYLSEFLARSKQVSHITNKYAQVSITMFGTCSAMSGQ